MHLQTTLLAEDERRRIHAQALRILEDVGVRYMSAKARAILRKAGARVDEAAQVARIPEELVTHALRTAPKSFVLGARNPAYDVPMPAPWTGYTLDGEATFALDFRTGERRNGTTADLAASLRVFEDLPLGTVVWPNVMLSDVPVHASNLHAVCGSLRHSSKHIQHELHAPAEIPLLLEALTAVLGSEEAVRRRRIFSVCYCTIPPLTHDAEMCETYLELATFGVPILAYPMPACGATGPASLFSNVAVSVAEALSTVVLFQLAAPGVPVIFGSAAGVMNFATGGFVEGAPESGLASAGAGEMARFYGLPNTQAGCLSDAKAPGPQAILEKFATTLPLVLGGADVINGIGELETSQLLVLEQLVVDHEIARVCRRLRAGVDARAACDLFADIVRAGPGGNFLLEDSTVAACRSGEFLMSDLVNRDTFEQWSAAGRPDLYANARRQVERMLETPAPHPLPDQAAGHLAEIVRRAEEALRR
jgi:trimethylamine--corrinoid protein Co-methyltransferase